jgi:Tfp pilus assembly protein PilO
MNSVEAIRKVLAYSMGLGLIFVAFYFLFWRPRLQHLKLIQEAINRRQNQVDSLKKDIATYPRTITEEKLQEVEANLREVFTKVPTEKEIQGLLKQIRQYSARKGNLDIRAINNITRTQKWDSQPELKISKETYEIVAQGSAPDVIRFLNDIESGSRLITIEDFKLERSTQDTHNVDMMTIFNIYYSNLEVDEVFEEVDEVFETD